MILFKMKRRYMDENGGDGEAAGGASPAAEPAAPAAVEIPAGIQDGSTPLDVDDISAMLSFDPFDQPEGDAPAADPTQTQAGDAPSADATPVGDDPATPVQAQPEPETPQENPEVVLMRQQLEQQQQLIAQMQQAQQQPQQPPAGSPQADPLDQYVPKYMFQIPDQMMTMLDSEDAGERRQGIQHLLSNSLRTVHRSVLEQMQGMLTTYVPQQLQQHSQTNELRSQVQSDFYGANTDLNTPEIRQIVQMVTPTVMQELGVTNWSPTVRDAIATKVRGMLNMQAQAQSAQPAAAPVQFDGGSRGPVAATDSITNDILSLM